MCVLKGVVYGKIRYLPMFLCSNIIGLARARVSLLDGNQSYIVSRYSWSNLVPMFAFWCIHVSVISYDAMCM